MSDLIAAVIKTRKSAEQITINSLENIAGISELALKEKILVESATHGELFPKGWYDPPEGGVAVLFDQKPFKRLRFETLRNSLSWPTSTSYFNTESVGMVYLSPVDRETKILGDIGFTIYGGNDEKVKEHIKKCYGLIVSIAKHAQVGMKFSDLYQYGEGLLQDSIKIIGWMVTTSSNPSGYNFGHTVPGSFGNDINFPNSFEEIKDVIRNERTYINEIENFIIPETCAFTVEIRLGNPDDENLPSVFFHFMVCFEKGKKTIMEGFEEIFNKVGMEWMNIK